MEAPNPKYFDGIVESAVTLELPGTGSGSAYRHHPRWIRRGNLLLLGHHNTHHYCEAFVLTEPNATVTAGMNAPLCNGDPMPRVNSGELVEVYGMGRWCADGPWQPAIIELLALLEIEIEAARLLEQKRCDAVVAARTAARAAKYEQLADNFGSYK